MDDNFKNGDGFSNNSNYGGQHDDSSKMNEDSEKQNANGSVNNGADDNSYSQYGGNIQYKWNYDDYQKALDSQKNVEHKDPVPKKKNKGLRVFLVSVGSVFAVALIVIGGIGIVNLAKSHTGMTGQSQSQKSGKSNSPALKLTNQPSTTSAAANGSMTYSQVAEKVLPSVVGVVTYDMKSVEPSAEGSGIIMTQDGYIITNNHVISNAKSIQVVTNDGKTYSNAKVVGKDSKTDLAVLKIDATGLKNASFGQSEDLKVGQEVIAIGNPGGLQLAGTVTNGIVSALNRSMMTESGATMKFIQTNALINPGNSGGPLVNLYGQVVGINSEKISESGYEGIGFAIPISTAKPVVDSIIKNGYVTGRVKLGITITPFTAEQGKVFNIPAGLAIASIEKDSDAATKGLKVDDIITKIDGISIASDDSSAISQNFLKEEDKHKVGDSITLTVYRYSNGSVTSFDVSIKLQEDKGDDDSPNTNDNNSTNGDNGSYSNGGGNGSYGSGGNYSNGNDNGDDNGNNNSNNYFGQ